MTGTGKIAPRQYVLEFPVLQSRSAEDFVIGRCNQVAASLIRAWPDWPSHTLILAGPEGSGKSHLAAIWAEAAGAAVLSGKALSRAKVPALGKAVVIERADRAADEQALFHLYNWLKGEGGHLLLTARTPPRRWNIALKDLASRLRAAPTARLEFPDEAILSAAMAKQFSDRQIVIDEAVISYLMKRMERSFPAVKAVVERVDRLSLSKKARVTIPLAREVLAKR